MFVLLLGGIFWDYYSIFIFLNYLMILIIQNIDFFCSNCAITFDNLCGMFEILWIFLDATLLIWYLFCQSFRFYYFSICIIENFSYYHNMILCFFDDLFDMFKHTSILSLFNDLLYIILLQSYPVFIINCILFNCFFCFFCIFYLYFMCMNITLLVSFDLNSLFFDLWDIIVRFP